MHDTKTEVARVQFKLNLKITEMELKSQPSTPPEVREEREVVVKEGVAMVDAVVVDCVVLFK